METQDDRYAIISSTRLVQQLQIKKPMKVSELLAQLGLAASNYMVYSMEKQRPLTQREAATTNVKVFPIVAGG